MVRRTFIAAALAAGLLAGCGPMTPEDQAKSDILVACAAKSEQLFPALATDSDGKLDEDAGINVRVGNDGHFVLEVPSAGPNPMSSFAWTCAGNVNRRTIELIEFDGIAKRPASGETWSY